MKNLSMSFVAAIVLFVASCSNEEILNENQVSSQNGEVQFTDAELKVLYQMRDENNKVSMDEATKLAKSVIGFLDGAAAVKSGSARRISSIAALTSGDMQSVALKSADGANIEIPDTVAYVFNFGEEDGYAIVSADTRIEDPILAYTGNGSLTTEVDNPGVALFLEGAEDYIKESIIASEQRKDSLINAITAKLEAEAEDEAGTKSILSILPLLNIRIEVVNDWRTTAQVTPLSSVEWGQGEPFNNNVKYRNCERGTTPTGCVATAAAQIMAYWKWPRIIDGVSFDWELLNRYTADPYAYDNVMGKAWIPSRLNTEENAVRFKTQVASLMERIGANVGMDYHCREDGGSGAQTADAVSFLKRLGFRNSVSSNPLYSSFGYDFPVAKLSLDRGQPVIATGKSKKIQHKFLGITIYTTYEGGHAWVIDGYLTQRQDLKVTVELINRTTGRATAIASEYITNEVNHIHNNWGWSGGHNGYYVNGCFNRNETHLPSNTKSGEEGNFQYKNVIYPFLTLNYYQ